MRRQIVGIVGVAAVVCMAYSVSTFADSPRLSTADYENIVSAILRAETRPSRTPRTIFIGLNTIDAKELVPALRSLYAAPTVVKGSGTDWATSAKDGCPYDKASGNPATGIFISAPHWHESGKVVFVVMFQGCSTTSHQNTYTFERRGGRWEVIAVEHGLVS